MKKPMKLCGRLVTTIDRGDHLKPRYSVDGMYHPKGAPIRFKSLDRAERHIRNMGKVVPE